MAESMFGNMYDARKEDMEANRKAAYDAAALGGYGTMAAVAGEMGGMLGGGIASSMGALQPAQAKQAAIQELMGEFPEPSTYKEYMTIAGRLSSQGYLDEATHFNELAKNASLTESKLAKANTPSDDTYKEAGNLMLSHFDTPAMQKELFKIQFPNLDAEALEEASNKKGAAETRLRRLKSATTSFTNYIKTNPKYKDKASLNTLLGNSDALMDEFKIFAGTRSNEHFKSLSSLLITADPASGFTKTTTEGDGAGEGSDDGAGLKNNAGTLGVTESQVNKDDSQNQQREQKRKAEAEISGRLHKQVAALNKDLIPWTLDSNLPASDLKKQQDRDATLTWLTTDGYNYFQDNTTTLERFESDPVGWWIENIKHKDVEVINALGL